MVQFVNNCNWCVSLDIAYMLALIVFIFSYAQANIIKEYSSDISQYYKQI